MGGWYKLLENLVWLTQLGLSMMMPLLLCLGGCWWLTNHTAVGGWIYAPGVFFGIAAGAVSFRQFSRYMLRKIKKDNPSVQERPKKPPVSFNKH